MEWWPAWGCFSACIYFLRKFYLHLLDMPTKASFVLPSLSRDGKKRITLEKQTNALGSGSRNLGVLLSGKDGTTYKEPPESAGKPSYLPRHQPLLFESDQLPSSFFSEDLLETTMDHVCLSGRVVLQSELPGLTCIPHLPSQHSAPHAQTRCGREGPYILALVVMRSMEIYFHCLFLSYYNYFPFKRQWNWRWGILK